MGILRLMEALNKILNWILYIPLIAVIGVILTIVGVLILPVYFAFFIGNLDEVCSYIKGLDDGEKNSDNDDSQDNGLKLSDFR